MKHFYFLLIVFLTSFSGGCDANFSVGDDTEKPIMQEIPKEAQDISDQIMERLLNDDVEGVLELTDMEVMRDANIDFKAILESVTKMAPDLDAGNLSVFWKEIRRSEDPKNQYPVYMIKYKIDTPKTEHVFWIATHDRTKCCQLRHIEYKFRKPLLSNK